VEPAITPLSWFFYRFFHDERLDLSADPLAEADTDTKRDPYDGNQAVPTLLFERECDRLHDLIPLFSIIQKSSLSLFAYPLSGGFRRWSLIPKVLASPLLELEEILLPALGKWMAFRMFVVLERVAPPESSPRCG
jgi:hypothetical protein